MAAYGNIAGFTTYAEAAGYAFPDGTTDAQKSAALLRGSLVIDRYEPRFSGKRAGGFAQDRAWPRTGASTYYGEAIPDNVIPAAIENAAYEAAFLELTNPGSLSPVITGSATVKREKIGSLEVEYSSSSSMSFEDMIKLATPFVLTIEGMLWMFFVPVLPAILVV
ncbi:MULTISPECIES: DnaT-like ssDNA-binding protein [unclassified Rhizobium]|uniref:DnaT-like ssDNA-binding protein n=1 Tax=unclassified Rhizobium TaxID=2613769 RepID=UPI00288BC142|nr:MULTISPECIES: DnaT-like ssDNA-binding protein [unclassified Rhizobium]